MQTKNKYLIITSKLIWFGKNVMHVVKYQGSYSVKIGGVLNMLDYMMFVMQCTHVQTTFKK
jgi:hypothetical protein